MISLHRIADPGSEAYRFVERLLAASFPPEEYRELPDWRALTAGRENFFNNLICDGPTPVGLLSYWDFGRFRYVEHFATAPGVRNRGYGERALKVLLRALPTPVVLEVEAPRDELARRRIGFYRRQGFVLWEREYRQPPYRPGDAWLPMHLMVWGDLPSTEFETVQATIYAEVYGICGE